MKLMSENSIKPTSGHKRLRRLQEKSQKAFQRWLQASNEWVLARHRAERNGDLDEGDALQQAQKLEKRLDKAAEAYEKARSKYLKT